MYNQYETLLNYVYKNGIDKSDRTGVGTRSCFGYQMRFDLNEGFPLITTKKVFIKSVIYELLWFLSGSTNVKFLNSKDVGIWDNWADDNGELGPIYGHQWRSWPDGKGGSIDQIEQVIRDIKKNPNSRRHIVSSWNVADIPKMSIPPCHTLFQFYVAEGKLSCQLYQRSADLFIGVPFNIASYALLTMMVSEICNLEFGDFIHTFGDVHIYKNHFAQVELQLERKPKKYPRMLIKPGATDLFSFNFEDFDLKNYNPHPYIKAPIAI